MASLPATWQLWWNMDIFTYDNLFYFAWVCSKNVKWKKSVSSYLLNCCDKTLQLYNKIQTNTYREKGHKIFKIYEPKEREVLSIYFRDRIYQRMLNDIIIYPTMTHNFIDDNCACQKGKGTDYARNKLLNYMRSYFQSHHSNNGYIIHIDVRHYYPSMNHQICEDLFKKYLDKETFDRVHEILKVYDGDVGYNPGSQLVQILGVSLLNKIDHYIKEKLYVKYYVRYMDDLILLVDNNPQFYIDRIEEKLQELQLTIHKEKTVYKPLHKGDIFLGFKFYLGNTGKAYMIISKQNIKRRIRKMKKSKGTKEEFENSYQTWRSYASKTSNKAILDKMDSIYNKLLEEKYDK